MSLGPLEIVLMVISWGFIALIHFVVFLMMRKDNLKIPKAFLLCYSVPACYTIGCLLTPPDLISSLTIALPCIILYTATIGCALLFSKHFKQKCKYQS